MEELILILPEEMAEAAVTEFKKEFLEHGEEIIHGSSLMDQLDYDEWIEHTVKYRKEENIEGDWVPSTTFFAVRQEDNRIVGIIDIRHHIEHPFLKEYAGHIGYAVRPSERRNGYAVKMLKCGLDFANSIGLEEVMISCYADNTGSMKTIQKHGGQLKEEKLYTDGKPMYIYWIDVT